MDQQKRNEKNTCERHDYFSSNGRREEIGPFHMWTEKFCRKGKS
jgi:hypothetical protein